MINFDYAYLCIHLLRKAKMGISLGQLLVILLIVLVIFGAGKLPQVMSDLGKGLKAFKEGLRGDSYHSDSKE